MGGGNTFIINVLHYFYHQCVINLITTLYPLHFIL